MLVGLKDTYYVNSNCESGMGRYDIMLEPKDKNANHFIFEFKVHKPKKQIKTGNSKIFACFYLYFYQIKL